MAVRMELLCQPFIGIPYVVIAHSPLETEHSIKVRVVDGAEGILHFVTEGRRSLDVKVRWERLRAGEHVGDHDGRSNQLALGVYPFEYAHRQKTAERLESLRLGKSA